MKIRDSWSRELHMWVVLMSDSPSSIWGNSVHFAKYPIFKRLLLLQFPSNFNQTLRKYGGIQATFSALFFVDLPNFKTIWDFHDNISYLSYIVIMHKAMCFRLSKGQAKRHGWSSCLRFS